MTAKASWAMASRMRPAFPIALVLLLAGCGAGDKTVFSSRASPNGSLVAESVMIGDDGEAGGQLAIRAKGGTEWHVDLANTAPDLFMRWIDDRQLEVWSERQKLDLGNNNKIGDVRIVSKSFEFPKDVANAYRRIGLNARNVLVPAEKVVATFVDLTKGTARICVLTISTTPDPTYDTANVEITAIVNPTCNRSRPCAGISTRFSLEDDRRLNPQATLTSATVSDIPSNNRLPTGTGGTSIRGQFLEQSAETLVNDLKGSSITLDFSRNFFDQVIRYELPLSVAAAPIGQFGLCVGDADMLWMRHRP
jgi:hypothetical protein